jgi:hypothetical protein
MREQGWEHLTPIQGAGHWYKPNQSGGVDTINDTDFNKTGSTPQAGQATAPTGNGASIISPSAGAVGGWAAGQMGQALARRGLLGNMMNAFNRIQPTQMQNQQGNNPMMGSGMGNQTGDVAKIGNPMGPSNSQGPVNQIPESWMRGNMYDTLMKIPGMTEDEARRISSGMTGKPISTSRPTPDANGYYGAWKQGSLNMPGNQPGMSYLL